MHNPVASSDLQLCACGSKGPIRGEVALYVAFEQEGSEISVRLECQSADGVHQDQGRQVEPMPTVTDRSSIIPVEYMRTIFKPRP